MSKREYVSPAVRMGLLLSSQSVVLLDFISPQEKSVTVDSGTLVHPSRGFEKCFARRGTLPSIHVTGVTPSPPSLSVDSYDFSTVEREKGTNTIDRLVTIVMCLLQASWEASPQNLSNHEHNNCAMALATNMGTINEDDDSFSGNSTVVVSNCPSVSVRMCTVRPFIATALIVRDRIRVFS